MFPIFFLGGRGDVPPTPVSYAYAVLLPTVSFISLTSFQSIDVKNIDFQIKKNIKKHVFTFIKTLKNMHKTLNYSIHST